MACATGHPARHSKDYGGRDGMWRAVCDSAGVMKTPILLAALLATVAGAESAASSAVSVEFHEPESYTDFQTSPIESEADRIALQRELRSRIEQIAEAEVPPNYHLELQIRDVDLAGDFEPEQGPDADDVRIIRGNDPPRITVQYVLKGPGGTQVDAGQRTLTNLEFQQTLKTKTDDRLYYETKLLRDFVSEITQTS